ncbi:MAG: MFS transporter [Trueperaceae bacterium]
MTSALMTTSSSMMQVMVPLYAVSLGLGPQWLGFLIALPGIFPVLLALQAGRIVDRGGPGKWLLIGMIGMCLAPGVLIVAPGVVSLVASRVIVGAFVLFVSLSAQSLTAAVDNGRSHQANYGAYSTWLAGGRMVGPVLFGAILDASGFDVVFVVIFCILAAGALLAYLLYRRIGSVRVDGSTDVVGSGKAFKSIVGNVGFQMAVFASAGIFLALTVREAFLPVMLEQLGMSATLIGTLVSIGSLTAVLIRLVMPQVVRLLGGTGRTLIITMAAVALGIGLLAVAESVTAFVILAVVVGFGTGIGFPLSIVAVATHVPVRQRGMALGLRLSASHLVETFVPALAGLLVAATSFAVGFGAAGVILGVLTVLSLKRLPRFEAMEREMELEVVARSAPNASAPAASAPTQTEAPAATEATAGAEREQVQDEKLKAPAEKPSAEDETS